MQVKSIAKAVAAITLTAVAASPALASTSLVVNGFTNGSYAAFITDLTKMDEATAFVKNLNGNPVGRLSLTWDNGSGPVTFNTYCTDIYQTTHFGLPADATYSVVAPPVDFGANYGTKAHNIGRLMTSFGGQPDDGDGAAQNKIDSAALQLAVWEILNEKKGVGGYTYNVAAGDFTVLTGAGQTNAAVAARAQFFLSNMGTSNIYHVNVLHSASNQDFLMLAPVPEPETYAMFLAGLGMMGFVARRRSQRA